MTKRRVLIVDDDASIRAMLKECFNIFWPHDEVCEAFDGLMALEQLRQQPVDLVLTDYQMPTMNGLALIYHIREAWPETRIILMTGYHSTELEANVVALGQADLLRKPFSIDQLLAKVDGIEEKFDYGF